MPLQNRVGPNGEIFRSTARGTFMGNRGGVLHNETREIVRPFKSHRWITCLLEFKNRWRPVMSPRRYTELFFLDEAVSFAAGHRPCAECRRDSFNLFKDAWKRSNSLTAGATLLAPEIDAALQEARIGPRAKKVTCEASLDSLPDGCFIQIGGASYLVWQEALLQWSPEGYVKKDPRPTAVIATVLTPHPLVECLRHGYRPQIHRSSVALCGAGL